VVSKYPAIVEPQATIESLFGSVQSLKIAVEMLSGQRPGGAALTRYEQPTSPGNPSLGDFWINTADAGATYYWNGHYWVDISNSRFEATVGQVQATVLGADIQAELETAWLAALKAEHGKISAEIAASVEQSRTEFITAIDDANASIATVQSDVDAARDEAQAAIADVNASIALVQADVTDARNDATAAFAEADAALAAAQADIAANQAATVAAQAEIQAAIAEANADIASNQAATTAAQADANDALAELQTVATTITQIQSNVASNSAAITVEAGARADADSAIAGQITIIQASVGSNSAAISNEIVARVNADSALSTRIDNISAASGGAAAAIDQEAVARIAGDNALAATITSLTTTVDGNTAAISAETSARTTADTAISAQISSLTATVNNNTAAITSEASTRASADTALSGRVTAIEASVTNAGASGGLLARVITEETARASGDTALAGQITSLTATVNNNQSTLSASVSSEATARANADSALSSRIDNITATAGGATAAVDAEAAARIAGDNALASQITTVSATASKQRVFYQATAPSATGRTVGDLWYDNDDGNKPYYWDGSAWVDNSDARFTAITASVTNETSARISADNALSAQITTLTSNYNSNLAAIQSEATTRANADTALSGQITSLTATVNSNNTTQTAAVNNEALARANADSALSSQISTVSATASKQRVFSQTSAPATTNRITGDLWIDTDDSNKLYYWDGSAWSIRDDPRIPTLSAAITAEQTARADADSALASSITTVSAAANRQRVFSQSTAPTSTGRSEGDLWFDSANGLKPYYWVVGTGWADNSDGRFTTIAASVTTETAARVSGDNALSAQITSLTSTVNGNTAAINNEATTRASADSALSGQISTVSATASKQRVFRQSTQPSSTGLIQGDLWFDTSNNNKPFYWSGSAWVDTTDARITSLQADVTNEVIARTNADSALSGQITTVSAVASKQRVFSQTTAPAATGRIIGDLWIKTDDSNKLYYWDGSNWAIRDDPRIPQLQASVTNEATARSDGDTALAAQISTVSAAANKQRVFNQSTAPTSTGRLVGDLWYDSGNGFKPYYWNGSAWVDNSDNRFTTIAASVTTETAARVSGDNALSAQITSLTSTVNGNTAAISSEATTRANADTALSGQITSLTSTVNNNTAAISSEATTRANADSALSGQITSLTTTVNNNKASLDQEITTRANADSALSSSLSSLTTTVNGNTSSISTLQGSYNGLAVKYGVTGTINGQTGGFVLTGIGKNDGSASYLLEITSNTIINGALLVNGSVSASKLSVTNLSAVSANMGLLTAGKIQSTDGRFLIDCDARTITIAD
jgi:hypothetical protein